MKLKGISSETAYMGVYLCTKFQVSSIILTSFRQRANFTSLPHTAKRTPKKPTQIRVKLMFFMILINLKISGNLMEMELQYCKLN